MHIINSIRSPKAIVWIFQIIKTHKLLVLAAVALFMVPFFWFKPGELNIGGDGSRLYFYDPANLIKNFGIYPIYPFGTGVVGAQFYYLPLITINAIIKQVIHSPYLLITFYDSMKIVTGFLAVYGIMRILLYWRKDTTTNSSKVKNSTAILAGLFYIFNPAMTENYVHALATHDQVFLNPLMFYLILKYIVTSRFLFLEVAVFTSLIFSHSFSHTAAPPFFAFYPLGLVFLFIFIWIHKIKLHWGELLSALLMFIGLHAFHIVSDLRELFSAGSNLNIDVFDKTNAKEMLGYFLAVMPLTKVSLHWLATSSTSQLDKVSILIPVITVLGLFLNHKKDKILLLTGIFFLITLYLVTAQISGLGVELYKILFYIPGFAMFKNFYGQWQFVYYFFYAVLFGQAVYLVIRKLNKFASAFVILAIAGFLVLNSWQFINGTLINQFNNQSDTRVGVVFDSKYEDSLRFVRSIPEDGKILVLPFSDYYFQVVRGKNNGAYVGRSMIGPLTGKKDFAGYMDIAPYSDIFWKLSKEQNYAAILQLFNLLNIQYIYYNSDPLIYDKGFPYYPYSPDYVRKYMPHDQAKYQEYVNNLTRNKIFEESTYSVYKLDTKYILPHFYAAKQLIVYDDDPKLSTYDKAAAFFRNAENNDIRTAYIDRKSCAAIFLDQPCEIPNLEKQDKPLLLQFQKINPTKYKVFVRNARKQYLLVFSEAFHKDWTIFMSSYSPEEKDSSNIYYFDGEIKEKTHKNVLFDSELLNTLFSEKISNATHIRVNGYANAWYITPKDVNNKEDYELTIELTSQRFFYLGLGISCITGIVIVMWHLIRMKKSV